MQEGKHAEGKDEEVQEQDGFASKGRQRQGVCKAGSIEHEWALQKGGSVCIMTSYKAGRSTNTNKRR